MWQRVKTAQFYFVSSGDLVLDVTDVGEKKFERSQPRIFRLIVALYHGLCSRSELLCYFAMVSKMMVDVSLIDILYHDFGLKSELMLCLGKGGHLQFFKWF